MSENGLVIYYEAVLALCTEMRKWVQINALYNDLVSRKYLQKPDSVLLFAKYYKGDFAILEERRKEIGNNCRKQEEIFTDVLVSKDIYVKEDAVLFYRLLNRTNDATEFRRKVRRWTYAELSKIERGRPATLFTPGDFLARFEQWELSRMGRGKKDQK